MNDEFTVVYRDVCESFCDTVNLPRAYVGKLFGATAPSAEESRFVLAQFATSTAGYNDPEGARLRTFLSEQCEQKNLDSSVFLQKYDKTLASMKPAPSVPTSFTGNTRHDLPLIKIYGRATSNLGLESTRRVSLWSRMAGVRLDDQQLVSLANDCTEAELFSDGAESGLSEAKLKKAVYENPSVTEDKKPVCLNRLRLSLIDLRTEAEAANERLQETATTCLTKDLPP